MEWSKVWIAFMQSSGAVCSSVDLELSEFPIYFRLRHVLSGSIKRNLFASVRRVKHRTRHIDNASFFKKDKQGTTT